MTTTRWWSALCGVVASLVGLGIGHLVAAFLDPAASPVLAVGSTVIDLTPTPVKEWAIRQFGTNDKPILIGSVFVGTLLLTAVAGVLARRRFGLGAGLLVLLVAAAGAAAALRPTAGPVDIVPAMVTGLVGVVALYLLLGGAATAPSAPGEGVRPGRRSVLLAGGLAALAAATGSAGQFLIRRRTNPADVTLPAAAEKAGAFPQGLDVKGISPLRTPNGSFYRVDTALVVPSADLSDWTLTIDGDVDREVTLSFEELTAMPMVERDITLNCVSNEVGGPYVGSARWLGVPLKDVLDLAGVGTKADQILSTSIDGFTLSTPLSVALDGRDTLIAVGMNGTALPAEHGFPARLLTPGLYGFVGATKWLTKLTLTTYDAEQAYWTKKGWAIDAPVKIASRIDTPKPLSSVSAGTVAIGGVAWAQQRGIGKVEVRIDGGAWQKATLSTDVGDDYWRQWHLPWKAEPGQHRIAVRAITSEGEVQSPARAATFPDGASGIQEIIVTVA